MTYTVFIQLNKRFLVQERHLKQNRVLLKIIKKFYMLRGPNHFTNLLEQQRCGNRHYFPAGKDKSGQPAQWVVVVGDKLPCRVAELGEEAVAWPVGQLHLNSLAQL
jgi:hypothetical protein